MIIIKKITKNIPDMKKCSMAGILRFSEIDIDIKNNIKVKVTLKIFNFIIFFFLVVDVNPNVNKIPNIKTGTVKKAMYPKEMESSNEPDIRLSVNIKMIERNIRLMPNLDIFLSNTFDFNGRSYSNAVIFFFEL